MKNILLLLCAIIFCGNVNAQVNCGSNLFPCSGNVGIGTAFPVANLHIKGASSSSGAIILQGDNGSATAFWMTGTSNGYLRLGGTGGTEPSLGAINIAGSGEIGIGMNPTYKLDIDGSGSTFRIGQSGISSFGIKNWTSEVQLGTLNSTDLHFMLNGGSVAALTNNNGGRFGIGTLSPSVKMHLKYSETSTTLGGAQAAMRIQNDWGAAFGERTELQFQNIGSKVNAVISAYYASNSGSEYGAHLVFGTKSSSDASVQERMRLTQDGVLMIGGGFTNTYDSRYKLLVEGTIGASEVYVTLTRPWPDYVFGKNYKLLTLDQLNEYIQQNKHLPNMPSAEQMQKEGNVNLGEMNAKLLEKVEELTLYLLQLKKENDQIKAQLEKLENKLK